MGTGPACPSPGPAQAPRRPSPPAGDQAVAGTLQVPQPGTLPQQPALAGVQGQQQVAHPVGVVDGLAEHRALLLLHQLLLLLTAQCRPQAPLFRCHIQSRALVLPDLLQCRG